MLFTQKSVLLASVALLAFVANQENGIMVHAQGDDKEDKEDDNDMEDEMEDKDDGDMDEMEDNMMENDRPVVINAPPGGPGSEMMMPNNGTDTMDESLDEDDIELPMASDDSNMTEIMDDEIDGCMCDGTMISCADPKDEEECMCEPDGTVVCEDKAPEEDPPVEAPTPAADVPVATPVAMPDDDKEPPAPDTGMDAAAATDDSSSAIITSSCSTTTMVAMALSAAGLAVALN